MNNRKYSPRTNKITVRITNEMKQDIQKFAEEYHIPTARAIRLAINFYLTCNRQGENNMKTFKDVHFKIRRPSGIVGKIDLGDDVEISIIMHESSYGGTQGLWEIACFDNKKGQVDLECLDHDVVGYLTFTELETKIREIQEELNNNSNSN